MITKLNTLDLGSMTTDCWTSNSTMSYLSLTVHFINEQFYFQSLTLNLHYLQSEHTANYLHASLEELLQSWNLKDKVSANIYY